MRCSACGKESPEGLAACPGCGAALTPPTAVHVTLDLRPGELFHGRYEIQETLGKGGMGVVYKARDRSLDETVAIKVLRPDFASDPAMAERFKSEIRLARRVRHRNVCGIHDYGESEGLLYISMELVEGVDLKQVVRRDGALPLDRACDVILQVAVGLQAVHDAGIIHRDLKTSNIMLEPTGVARLMDFGIAKRQGAEGGLTVTGQVVGTPEYMSPEQAQGARLDARADLYSLGVVAYEVLTGRVPFRGETPISTILKHIHDPPPFDSQPGNRLPSALRDVLRCALAKTPDERYPTSTAFAEAVQDARRPSRRQEPSSAQALEATTVIRAPGPRLAGAWRRRRLWAAAAVAAVALGTVAVRSVWREGTGGESTEAPVSAPTPQPSPSPPLSAAGGVPVAASTEAATAPSPTASASLRSEPKAVMAPRRVASPFTAEPRVTPRSNPAAPPAPATPVPPATPTPTPVATRAPETSFLQVGVIPWATVTVDGREMGTTPLDKIPVGAGRHVIKLRHPAYREVERDVVVSEGATTRFVFDFTSEGERRP
jgi:serine/threonine protein kinase